MATIFPWPHPTCLGGCTFVCASEARNSCHLRWNWNSLACENASRTTAQVDVLSLTADSSSIVGLSIQILILIQRVFQSRLVFLDADGVWPRKREIGNSGWAPSSLIVMTAGPTEARNEHPEQTTVQTVIQSHVWSRTQLRDLKWNF